MRRFATGFGGLASFTLALAAQVLGYQSGAVGVSLILVGAVFLLLTIYPQLLRLRIEIAPTIRGASSELFVRTQTVRLPELWKSAREFLRAAPRNQLLVYAPTGVWEISKGKRQWFGTIATCLLNGDPEAVNELEAADFDADARSPLTAFYGVFGLPRRPIPGDPADLERFRMQLADIEKLLKPLARIRTAHLRYLETDVTTIPGTGAIVFGHTNVAFAFAVGGHHVVDYVIFLHDVPEIGQEVSDWFHNHALKIADANVLQEMSQGVDIDLACGFAALRAAYGLQASVNP